VQVAEKPSDVAELMARTVHLSNVDRKD